MARLTASTVKPTRVRLLEVAPRGTLGAGNEPSVGSGGDVPVVIKVPTTQTVDALEVQTPTGTVLFAIDKAGQYLQGGVGAKQCVVQVALTAAQITTLHSAPVALVAAPGAAYALVADALIFQFKYGTVQFTGGGATNPVYHGATTNLLGASVAAPTVQAAASASIGLGPAAGPSTLTANAGIDLYAATADYAAGDGTALVTLWYTIYTLG